MGVISFIVLCFKYTASSFLPEEDQGIIFANIQLDNLASINQTNSVLKNMTDEILKMDGIEYMISVAGYSMLGGGGENVALGVVGLKDWNLRKNKSLSVEEISKKLREKFINTKNAEINFFAPPSIPGIGQSDGLSLELVATDSSKTPKELDDALNVFLDKANEMSIFARLIQNNFNDYKKGFDLLKKLKCDGIKIYLSHDDCFEKELIK